MKSPKVWFKLIENEVINYDKQLTIGIDATNLHQGGGVTHLIELLRSAEPERHHFKKIMVWGGKKTLDSLQNAPWLIKCNPPSLNKGLFHRLFWQRYRLSGEVSKAGCDLFFVPGGNYLGNFRPFVIMSRNLLPFQKREMLRYGMSFFTLKLFILRLSQSRSFRKANGIIFLNEYAKNTVLEISKKKWGEVTIIPHGLNSRFQRAPKEQQSISEFNSEKPYRLIYVSKIDQYKHQWHVIEAVARLRKEKGISLVLELIGADYPPALRRLDKCITLFDPERSWVHYHGEIPYSDLHSKYAEADLGIFASSCENMPNILLETMSSGLPVACSQTGPMPEILKDGGVYFDPEQAHDISRALWELIESPALRYEKARISYQLAQQYTWQKCANNTFAFLTRVASKKENK